MEQTLDFSTAPPFGRAEGIRKALNLLHQINPNSPFIVETGTSRGDLGGGVSGDGQATIAFAWYCKKFSGHVWTIDILADAIENCKAITKEYDKVISYFATDSISALSKVDQTIDLLYLDSANDPMITLSECLEAYKHLSSSSIIFIDDTSISKKRGGGICKGVLAYQFLYDRGWNIVFDDGNQIIMTKSSTTQRNFLDSWLNNWKVKSIYKRVHRKDRERAFEILKSTKKE